jgi:hypothetical protein
MSASVISDFIVPKSSGKAFKVNKGQLLRVIECEGKQVAGLMFFNAHNFKEQFMAEFSGGLSYFQPPDLGRIGSHYRLGELYSKVPYENLMLRVTDNKIGDHFLGTLCEIVTTASMTRCLQDFHCFFRAVGPEKMIANFIIGFP